MNKLILIKYINNILRINQKNKKELAILTSKKYLHKVKEDLILENYFLRKGINAKLIAWEEYNDEYKNILIKSTWGYQHDITNFINFLKKNKNKLINNFELINNNINKYNQIKYLKENKINCIDTQFIDNLPDLEKKLTKEYQVIKPVISASSHNTYKINLDNYKKYLKEISITIKEGYLLQPFLNEIKDGELSIIIVNKKISHYLNRYPGKFTDKPKLEKINKLNPKAIEVVNKIIDIYQSAAFIRLDLIYVANSYKVMEVEVIEPQLFFEQVDNKKELYNNFINEVKKHLK